jgi:plasmid maintenance system antidote protein VapI
MLTVEQLGRFFADRPHLSKAAISKAAGLSRNYVSKILNGEKNITININNKLIITLKKYGYEK